MKTELVQLRNHCLLVQDQSSHDASSQLKGLFTSDKEKNETRQEWISTCLQNDPKLKLWEICQFQLTWETQHITARAHRQLCLCWFYHVGASTGERWWLTFWPRQHIWWAQVTEGASSAEMFGLWETLWSYGEFKFMFLWVCTIFLALKAAVRLFQT